MSEFKELQEVVHKNAIKHGWWDCPTCESYGGDGTIAVTGGWNDPCPTCNGTGHYRNIGESLALIHSEVSEALEAKRDPENDANCSKCDNGTGYYSDFPCPKCNNGQALGRSRFAEELADVVIRVMDLAEFEGIDLFEVMKLKHAYNVTRPHKHGKKF